MSRYSLHRRNDTGLLSSGLRTAPLIDVVFLLLVFFLLTANFRQPEGFLPARLPRAITLAAPSTEVDPLTISVRSISESQCEVLIGRETGLQIDNDNFAALNTAITDVLTKQSRRLDDPIRLAPDPRARWDHVVKCYNTLQELRLTHIIFIRAPKILPQ